MTYSNERIEWKSFLAWVRKHAGHVCDFLSRLLSDQTALGFIPRLMTQKYCRNWNIVHYSLVQKAGYENVMKKSSCVMPNIHYL